MGFYSMWGRKMSIKRLRRLVGRSHPHDVAALIPYNVGVRKISRFVKRVNYGKPIKIVYGNTKGAMATIRYHSIRNWDGSVRIIDACITAHPKVCYPSGFLLFGDIIKSIMMHEVGHLYTRWYRVGQRVVRKRYCLSEHDANRWAIKRAKQMGLKRVVIRLREDDKRYKVKTNGRMSNARVFFKPR